MNADEIVMALREKYDETDVVYFFARTIFREAAYLIESLQAQLAAKEQERQAWQDDFNALNEGGLKRIAELEAQLTVARRRERDARNELCLKCGRYHEAHNGACDGCRWKEN